MPREITDKMGIKFVSLPEEKEKEQDDRLLSILLITAPDHVKEEVKKLLGENYFNLKLRKYNKILGIYNNNGKTVDISKTASTSIKSHSRFFR